MRNMWRTNGRMNFPLDGLVLYVPLGHPELSGSPITAKIPLGGGFSCTVTGAVHNPPTHRAFDGDDYIIVPTDASLNMGTGDFSMICTVKTSAATKAFTLGKGTSGNNPWYNLGVFDGGEILVALEDDGMNPIDSTEDGDTVSDGEWHCIGASIARGAVDTITRFMDGVQTGTVDDISAITGAIDPSQDLAIGAGNEGSTLRLTGDIGELWIYKGVALAAVDHNHIAKAIQWRYV